MGKVIHLDQQGGDGNGEFAASSFKVFYYEIIDITAGTSGSLASTPAGATIQEGDFGGAGNSVASTLNAQNKPTFQSPLDGGGNPITVNVETDGDWNSSDTFANPIAVIYSFIIAGADYVNVDANFEVDRVNNDSIISVSSAGGASLVLPKVGQDQPLKGLVGTGATTINPTATTLEVNVPSGISTLSVNEDHTAILMDDNATTQSLVAGVPQKLINWTSDGPNQNATPDFANGKITVNNPGLWLIGFGVRGTYTANNESIAFEIYVNGSPSAIGIIDRVSNSNGNFFIGSETIPFILSASDELEIFVTGSLNGTMTCIGAELWVVRQAESEYLEFTNVVKVDPNQAENTGKMYPTIAAALTFANANATASNPIVIWLNPGTHNIDTQLVFDAPYVHMHGFGSSETVIQVHDDLAGVDIIETQKSNSLRGFKILGSGVLEIASGTQGILISADGDYSFDDIRIDKIYYGLVADKTTGVPPQIINITNTFRVTNATRAFTGRKDAVIHLENIEFRDNLTAIVLEDTVTVILDGGIQENTISSTQKGIVLNGTPVLTMFNTVFADMQKGIEINGLGAYRWSDSRFSNVDTEIEFTVPATVNTNNVEINAAKIISVMGATVVGTFQNTVPGGEAYNIANNLRVGTINNPKESFFGSGGPFTNGMLVYTETDLNVFANVTAEASSNTGSTFGFPGVIADNAIYIGNTVEQAGTLQFFYGFNLTVDDIGDIGAGEIIGEYWNGSIWAPLKDFAYIAEAPYLPITADPFGPGNILNREINFNSRIDIDWVANDPMSLGQNFYWVRYRIDTDITTTPLIEQIKIVQSFKSMGPDGYVRKRGKSRTLKDFGVSLGDLSPVTDSPGDQDLFRADNQGVGRVENSFAPNSLNVSSFVQKLPADCDTSCPLVVNFDIQSDGDGGDIYWRFIIDSSNDTDRQDVYTSTTGGAGSPATTPTQKIVDLIVLAPTAANEQVSYQVELDIEDFVARRLGGRGDSVWLTMQRLGSDGQDTHTGNANVIDLQTVYTSWSDGGFDTTDQTPFAAPMITSGPPKSPVFETTVYSYQASATGGGIVWSLSNEPVGMTINTSTGSLTWPSTVLGNYPNIEIIATNTLGTDNLLFTLDVVVDPVVVTDGLLFVEADDLSLPDGAAVSTWMDKFPTNNDLTQGDIAEQPIYKDAIFNGNPVVRFDGTEFMSVVGMFEATTTQTIIAVFSFVGAVPTKTLWSLQDASLNTPGFSYLNRFTNSGVFATFDGSSGNNSAADEFSPYGDGNPHIFVASNSGAQCLQRIDKVNLNTYGEAVAAFNLTEIWLAAFPDESFPSDMDVAAFIVYKAQKSIPEIEAIEDFFISKYGI